MDHKKKFFLFKKSDNFCSVPWNQLKVDTAGNVSTCTYGREIIGSIIDTDVKSLLGKTIPIKEELIQDQKSNNCTRCHDYSNNDIGYTHLRNHYNELFVKNDIDYNDTKSFQLHAIDLHWSSLCQLKCITCWHVQSSSIAKEEGKPIQHTPNKDADRLIEYIISNQYQLNEIYMSGGEPSLIDHNYRLLKQLDKSIDCQFRVNTNMMFDEDNKVVNELLKFKNVLFTISADGMGQRFEYIRQGASWKKFISNLDRLQNTHITWRVNSVFFVGTADILVALQRFFRDNYNITDFTVNQEDVGHYNIQARQLDADLKDKIREDYQNYMDEFPNDLSIQGAFNNCLQELDNPATLDYVDYFNNVDRKYGSNWKEVFTEL